MTTVADTADIVDTAAPTADETAKAEALARIEADPLGSAMRAKLVEQINEYNTQRKVLDANSGDIAPLLEDLRNTSEDSKVVDLRSKVEALDEKREQLIQQMNALVSEFISSERLSDEDAAKMAESLKSLRSAINQGVKYAEANAGLPGLGLTLPGLVGSRSAGVTSGAQTGIRRPRVSTVYVDGAVVSHEVTNAKTNVTETRSTFTDAAKALGIPATELHAAFFPLADNDDEPEVTFSITGGDKETHTVKVVK